MRKTLTLSFSWSCKFYQSFKGKDELNLGALLLIHTLGHFP